MDRKSIVYIRSLSRGFYSDTEAILVRYSVMKIRDLALQVRQTSYQSSRTSNA